MARLILHIGQAKTGSTSIQYFLARNRRQLRRSGVIYPALGGGFHYNHHALMPLFVDRHHIGQNTIERTGYSEASMLRVARASAARLQAQAAQNRETNIVLSGESFLKALSAQEVARLDALLSPLNREIEVFAYLRDPASFYLSMLQQSLRHCKALRPLAHARLSPALIAYHQLCGGRLRLRAFRRSSLVSGDVVADFLEWTGLDRALEYGGDISRNETLSAEAMAVLALLGPPTRPSDPDGRARQKLLQYAVRIADRTLPGATRPQLNDLTTEEILARASDLHILRDQFGFEIPGIDYAAVNSAEQGLPRVPARLDEVVPYDRDRADALRERVDSALGSWTRHLLPLRAYFATVRSGPPQTCLPSFRAARR